MNELSPRKWNWPTVVPVLVTAAALVTCLLLAGYLVLPALVTDRLPVAQIRRLGFADFTGRVSRIGLHQTAAGPLVFGLADQPALSIDSIVLDYSPEEVRQKKIRSLRISGLTVNATLGPDGMVFPGLDTGVLKKNTLGGKASSDASSSLAGISVDKIEIRSGMVNLAWRNVTHKIPFEADMKSDGRGMMNLDAHVRLFPRDQLLAVAAQVDIENRKAKVGLDAKAIDLDRFADLIHLLPGLDATGDVTVQTNARVMLTPFAIMGANVDLTWRSGRLTYGIVNIEPGGDEAAASLSAVTEDLASWQIDTGGLRLQTPVPLIMNRLSATVNLGEDIRGVTGNVDMTVLPISVESSLPVTMKSGVPVPVTFDVTRKATGEWTAGFRRGENNPPTRLDPLDITIAGASIHGASPRFSLTATGDGQKGAADWQLGLNALRATAAGTIVNLPSADARGQLQFKRDPHGPSWVGDAQIRIPNPTVDGSGVAAKIDALTLSARFHQQGGDAPVIDARLRFSDGRFQDRNSGLHLSGGRLDLPFRSDHKATVDDGTFSIARIDYRNQFLGKIQGRIAQKMNAYAFAAAYESDLFPGMTAAFTGNMVTRGLHFGDADVTFQVSPYELPAESDLGRFIPAMKGVTLSGTISAKGKASHSLRGFNGDVDVSMKGGELEMAEKKIAVAGIDTTLHFPELPRIRSGPAQHIEFSRAAMGGIVVDGGSFDLQVESGNTLFIEKGRLDWCGGKVDAQALRIAAGKQDYQVSLYCQRLGLSRILEQLGAVNARGSGTVNGMIPIAYTNGRIRFDDGFLFSTPGETGQIQLTGTDILTRGIPAGTPQFAQVELAQAALKDYAYTWAKLGLMSEGEDFVMRLQFDGKPANPLPFIYKKEIGGFIRVEAGAQGSVFQGIGLDVNLRLPLNQLLQYKDVVNMIQ
ncbi:YdbH domain-containing protein [uncultured Desulfosarcina sp.]|uniref:intermembrane phospholipid transport protein YdbH family protein n=1 Tax=uncultured Desulfosarcina sp. TaxID=218289 RepID=UPI0029C92ACD|nr:YdbH domain-containing protein [uncultured Desulfosarcina sp.]